MISTLFLGIAGGFVLSIPPGPISLAAMRQVLAGATRAGVLIVAAAAVMDIVYMLVATFASSAIVATLSGLVAGSVWFPLLFQAACVAVLVYLGITYLIPEKSEEQEEELEEKELRQEERARKMGHSSPFFLGLVMAVTNLASPTFLPSMIAFVGFLQANRWLVRSVEDNILFSGGFGVGTMLWFLLVLRVLVHFRSRMSASFIVWIYRIAGGSMVLFAIAILYHLAAATEWSVLLR